MGLFSLNLQRPLVGLDIGVSGIKAVELSSGKVPRLVAYNRVPLPWNAISRDGEVKERAVIVDALKKLFETKTFTGKRVAIGIAGNSVITKKISVPRMKAEELKHQLYWEAEQYIPFDVNDVNLDFAILGNSSQTQTGNPMMDVLLVAAKKDYVHSFTSLLEEAGLQTEIIDIQAFALGNVFEFNYGHLLEDSSGAMNVIIDFGAASTKISVVELDKTTFTRELRLSGIACTMMLCDRLSLPFDQAERMKIHEGGSSGVKPVLDEFVEHLADEVARTLDFAASQSSEKVVQAVYYCGGASRTVGLIPALEKKISFSIKPLNPIQNISGSGRKMNAEAIKELSYLGAVGIGLSLRVPGDAG